jgi:uncharacterized repeat protein (TIGR01451 family)
MIILRTLIGALLGSLAGGAFALTLNLVPSHPTCNYPSGHISVFASGGTPPYAYQWSTGATTQDISDLLPGIYSVTVTDALAAQETAEVELVATPYALFVTTSSLPWCTAPYHILEDPLVSGVQNNWTVNGFPAATPTPWPYGFRFPASPSDTWFEYPIDDGNGCTGTVSGTNGEQIIEWPEISVVNVEPSCADGASGAIHVQVNGGFTPNLPYTPYIGVIDDAGINPSLFIIPEVGGGGTTSGLAPGTYGLRWWIGVTAESLGGPCPIDTIWVTVPNTAETCGQLTGTSYVDADEDCLRDLGEWGIPYSPLLIQPGDEIILTDQDGNFNIPLIYGAYTLAQQDPFLELLCPAVQPIDFTISPGQTVVDLANSSAQPLDLSTSLTGGVFRPGFETSYAWNVRNLSAQPSGSATLTITLDPTLSQVSIHPVPSSINGNTITWDLPTIGPYAMFSGYVRVVVPAATPLGSLLNTTLVITNAVPDANSANDVDVAMDEVVGSYDPNDKRATTSSRASDDLYFIDDDAWIDYTIRFQNTGTFYAEFVVITDTLPATLDLLTFEQGAASHPFTIQFKPGRIVEWRFDNIFLPDSTTDEPGSHGMVKFRIRPRMPLAPGTMITNVANIYFDFNPPVITEPSVLVAEFSTEVDGPVTQALHVSPNPANDQVRVVSAEQLVRITLTGTDGRILLEQPATRTTSIVHLDQLPAGAYVLSAFHHDGSVEYSKLTKY